MSSTVVVVPREATATKLHSVTTANATDSGAFLKHDVCLRTKSTAGTACPTGTAPAVGVQVPMSNAKFFTQVWTVANGDKATHDTVEWAQEWTVAGDCNSTATMKNCNLFNKTFGTSAAAGAMNDM